VVFLTKQTNRIFLLDRPVVDCEHQVLDRLDDKTYRKILGLLRTQLPATLRDTLRRISAVERVLIWVAAIIGSVGASPVSTGVLSCDDFLIDGYEVRRAETLGPRGPEQQRLKDLPAKGNLWHCRVAYIREVLEADSELHIKVLKNRQCELTEQ